MEVPDGLDLEVQDKKTKVCMLKKSLYGLKTSPKKWNKKFTEEAEKLGLERDLHDPCLFTWRKDGKMIVMCLYVDDSILAGNDKERLEEIKQKLSKVFQLKDLGEPDVYLGMKITKKRKF